MKKLLGFLFAVLVIYVIYIDLTVGTLPSYSAVNPNQETSVSENTPKIKTVIPSFNAEVKPGQTVISIVEHQLGKSLPVSISQLINDFKKLNPDKDPEKIQIGITYHFPDYSK
ncbi:hypothetical protein [Neobacillus mesonae]|uniref:hypothetical protein n=1 Tax=Neobacillus mesonae TaxID=1193713 RepID=UPI00203D5E3C|nr:hypothetical protein [Neobacillus mesonae]MCM3566599.1 hypothetical protein [Neobacillus mesonae]